MQDFGHQPKDIKRIDVDAIEEQSLGCGFEQLASGFGLQFFFVGLGFWAFGVRVYLKPHGT